MSNKKILNIVGIAAFLAIVVYVLKQLKNETDTKLYSDKGYSDLHNPDKLSELNESISEYQKSGKWK